MIRSSRWGSAVDVTLNGVPPGDYQVFLYVWEDNHSEQFDLLLNGRLVQGKFHSGAAGSWRRLGPWPAVVSASDRTLTVAARGPGHGAANLSGIEVWAGTGPVPEPDVPSFVVLPTPDQVAFFERRIRPVLSEHCYECHSAAAAKLKGGLLLDSRAGVVRGGDTGPVVTPGEPDASLLIRAIRHADPNLTMPPKGRLPPEVVSDLESWVRQGAPDPRMDDTVAAAKSRSEIHWDEARAWWSLRPLADVRPPPVLRRDWPAGPLDAFVLARMEAAGLQPASDANRATLLRRVTFDLTGLPPTPEEVRAFVGDPSPDAWTAAVDRLLESPQYGERWGRHWLDVVRYADTAGDNSDFPIPQMYRYRNWVIEAFNRDLPYDQFIREQLAGDLLASEDGSWIGRIVATGYLANARRFGSRVDDYPQHLTIEDTLDNLGRAFLGLSINCARCHDHKFDPITTEDYYALYGILHSTRYPWPGIELDQKQRDLVPLVPAAQMAEAEAARAARDAAQRRLEREVQRLKDSLKETPAESKPDVEARIREAEQAARDHALSPLPFELAYAVADASQTGNVAVQQKGDPARPGAEVPRRFLTVLGGAALPPGETSSGRLQLAAWIADPSNPLTARVMVNRIWLHHFGRGLVPTPNDFGRQGRPPSNPELLDWLAHRFVESGWSVKAMHRLILGSRTWRQSSARCEIARERDPANELLSGFPRRRLDAESLRDTLLTLGGTLDLSPGGAHPFPPSTEWKFTQHNPFKAVYDTPKRSVYLMTQRIQRHPLLATFDGADPAASTPVRLASTTPVQALFLLNDPLVHDQAARFAGRLVATGGDEVSRIREAHWRACGRDATPEEVAAARGHLDAAMTRLRDAGMSEDALEAAAWQSLVRVLFRLNEFLYLD
ncbi:MAG: PSD1 domain-containing protein [Verrucomicrobiae bacterium]|nr:PSD1 domain-containing protein [Verrucomicrobiae bacterium]